MSDSGRKRNWRRGFIIIFGWRPVAKRDGSEPVQTVCPNCGEATTIVGKVRRQWFTLFFIPVLPLESEGHRFCECCSCKAQFDMTIEQFRRKVGNDGQNPWEAAIRTYNMLRESPADPSLLCRLMQMYIDLGELGEAETAARHFPQALAASPQCQQLLESVQRELSGGVTTADPVV